MPRTFFCVPILVFLLVSGECFFFDPFFSYVVTCHVYSIRYSIFIKMLTRKYNRVGYRYRYRTSQLHFSTDIGFCLGQTHHIISIKIQSLGSFLNDLSVPVHSGEIMSSFLNNNILTIEPNDDGAREYLTSINWPQGLQNTFMRGLRTIPIRFFIFDDSGSVRFEYIFILLSIVYF